MKYLFASYLFITPTIFGQVFDGMTLFSPAGGGGGGGNFSSFLIDNDLNAINTWDHPRGAASMPYLLPDSTLIYPYRVPNPTMNSGGVGGGISKYSWDGELLWNYEISNETYQHHHDVEPLPNGNILVIVWEHKTADEAYAVGRQSIDNSLNAMWSEAILELEPVGTNDVNIVWEWHLWDHLIQDVDPDLPNYGVISDHPELQDINYGNAGSNGGPGGANGDWKHFNAVAYNEDLDQIALSSRFHDEIYIIDHSTTTEEAAGHTGGNSGMGGDFLYRWGNPQVYDRGSDLDRVLDDQHSVNWIPEGYPGEGNLILFNNNYGSNSAVFEIVTPINEDGTYSISPGQPYGPIEPIWIHTGPFHTQMQGGAFRLPNGNTLITDCNDATIFEVTYDHEIVWANDFSSGAGPSFIARAQKYSMDYLGGEDPDYIHGDVNFDGLVNLQDGLMVSDMASGFGYAPNAQADFNDNGAVSVDDAVQIMIYIMGF